MLDFYFKSSLLKRILIALFLGISFGLMNQGADLSYLSPVGSIFVRLLKMIVIPTVFFSIMLGASSIEPNKLGSVGSKIFGVYLFTMAIAVVVGLVLSNSFGVGFGLDIASHAHNAKELVVNKPPTSEVLLAIIPTNPFASLASGSMLPVIFFAVIFGISISVLMHKEDENLKSSGISVQRVIRGSTEAMFLVVKWVMEYAPIGIFALVAEVFASQGPKIIGEVGELVGVIYLSYFVQIFVVLFAMVFFVGLSPKRFYDYAKPAYFTAFSTRSSASTLPVTMQCAERMGIKESIYSFALPLGATINMNGAAIYIAVCITFISNLSGIHLSISEEASIVFLAVFGAIGAAGVPGGSVLILLMTLQSLNYDMSAGSVAAIAYGIILGVNPITDMGETALNVTGDLASTLVVSKVNGDLDMKEWHNYEELV